MNSPIRTSSFLKWRGRVAKALISLAATLLIPLAVNAAPPGYIQTNLVSDGVVPAVTIDPNLKNPWGIAFFSGMSPFWIADNGSGVSTLYDGTGIPFAALPVVDIPLPSGVAPGGTSTGLVANTLAFTDVTAFPIDDTGPALFIFDTEDGTLAAWNLTNFGGPAVIVVNNSDKGAVYKGLAMGTASGKAYLYATNFHSGKIDVFDHNYAQVTWNGAFVDPKMEKGYAPFGITNIDGNLWVTYAVQDKDKHDDVSRPNHGLVDVFDTSGNFIRRFVSHNRLNSPWAVVKTPASFGSLGGKILIGNFGDGRIPAYDPVTGDTKGYLRDTNGKMISLPGLWSLVFSDAIGASPNTLYFTAGLNDEQNGLFGSFTPEK
jgi:uncharacterized protein (TIGR03118 family)